jgi:hypothetical protein
MQTSPIKLVAAVGRGLRNRRTAVALAALPIALVVGILWAGNRHALTASEQKLVGTWIRDQSPGVKRVLTLDASRHVHACDVNAANVVVAEVLGDKQETWYVADQNLFLRRGRKGRPPLREWLGDSSNWWDKWHITFQSADTLILESQGARFAMTRAADDPARAQAAGNATWK